MKNPALRMLVFIIIGLPIGFVVSSFAFALMGRDIHAPSIFPWALALAVIVGAFAGWKGSGGNTTR